jgi:hypothetical protein
MSQPNPQRQACREMIQQIQSGKPATELQKSRWLEMIELTPEVHARIQPLIQEMIDDFQADHDAMTDEDKAAWERLLGLDNRTGESR